MSLHSFTIGSDRFLQYKAVHGNRLRGLYDNPFASCDHSTESGIILIQPFFRAIRLSQQIRTVRLTDTLAYLFQYADILRRETPLTVGGDIQQESRVSTYSTLIDIEHVVRASHTLAIIISVEPTLTNRRISLSLLIMQIFCLE